MNNLWPQEPRQLELALYPVNRSYINKVIREDPYVKILGAVEWSMHWDSLVAVAQVEGSLCVIALKEVTDAPNH